MPWRKRREAMIDELHGVRPRDRLVVLSEQLMELSQQVTDAVAALEKDEHDRATPPERPGRAEDRGEPGPP